ncbi:hypothetical protein [Rhabdochromatium marinum]|uniref:hypothetical protein n=1 Tax=Rhabdochromatium marinum TaxID=48729 RepID=UPI0019041499|nr:hypothetical protein [Rhabdochromatium marinum]MBK1649584.1 hypothetical protein [Rhabdochromatium marinum]
MIVHWLERLGIETVFLGSRPRPVDLLLVTMAATFSTGSVINVALFSTSRLMEHVSRKGE